MQNIITAVAILTHLATAQECTVYHRVVETTCAEACLTKIVGKICPRAIVVKAGHLDAGTCKDVGYTVANGTTTQKAGPCGMLTFNNYLKPATAITTTSTAATTETTTTTTTIIPLVTFDGAPKTTFQWTVVDDPVMGGKSHSTFHTSALTGIWEGLVNIVPFLHSPGFCTIRTSSDATFPDVSGTSKLKVLVRNNVTSKLTEFSLQLQTKGGVVNGRQGTYSGNVTVPNTGKWVEVSAEWSQFAFEWRGEQMKGPKLVDQLNQIEQLGLSTYFPGKVGTFDLDIKSFSAGN